MVKPSEWIVLSDGGLIRVNQIAAVTGIDHDDQPGLEGYESEITLLGGQSLVSSLTVVELADRILETTKEKDND